MATGVLPCLAVHVVASLFPKNEWLFTVLVLGYVLGLALVFFGYFVAFVLATVTAFESDRCCSGLHRSSGLTQRPSLWRAQTP